MPETWPPRPERITVHPADRRNLDEQFPTARVYGEPVPASTPIAEDAGMTPGTVRVRRPEHRRHRRPGLHAPRPDRRLVAEGQEATRKGTSVTSLPLPIWPGWHTMPQPPSIRWSERACEALEPARAMPPLPELLWRGTGPAETPLLVPARARDEIPGIAEALDRGYELRRTAGLPDGRN